MQPQLDSDLLRTFVAIADHGGFTRAADVVSRTQSAVSMQMKRLEDEIGRPLFERDGRNVRLTPEGSILLNYARRILRLQSEVLNTLREPEMVGTVRIGSPDDYVNRFLPGILANFARSYPLVQVEVACQPTHRLLEMRGDAIDLAIITSEPGTEQGDVLLQEPLVWVTSESHAAHETDPLPLALFDDGCVCHQRARQALDGAGRSHRVAYISPSLSGILAAVGAGLAVTTLIQSIVPPGLRRLGSEEGFPDLHSVSIELRRVSSRRARAIDCLAEYIREGFRVEEHARDPVRPH